MTPVSTASVGSSRGTEIVTGPRPRIWCSAGTGLRSQGWAGPAPPSSVSRNRWPSGSSKSSVARPPVAPTSPTATPRSASRARHQPRLASPATRSPVRAIECVPRRSRATGQSKKVMSVPGEARPSA